MCSYVVNKYQYANGLTGRLGVDIPPVLDTVDASCLHNFILDRPVLSIVYDILAAVPLMANTEGSDARIRIMP